MGSNGKQSGIQSETWGMEGHLEQGARETLLQELLCGYLHLQEPIFLSEESHHLNPKSLPLPQGPWRRHSL